MVLLLQESTYFHVVEDEEESFCAEACVRLHRVGVG